MLDIMKELADVELPDPEAYAKNFLCVTIKSGITTL